MCVLGLIHVVKNTYNFVKLINSYNPCKAVARKRREAKPTVVPPSHIRHAFYLWSDWARARQSSKRHSLSRVFPGIHRRKRKKICLSSCLTEKYMLNAYYTFIERCVCECGNTGALSLRLKLQWMVGARDGDFTVSGACWCLCLAGELMLSERKRKHIILCMFA